MASRSTKKCPNFQRCRSMIRPEVAICQRCRDAEYARLRAVREADDRQRAEERRQALERKIAEAKASSEAKAAARLIDADRVKRAHEAEATILKNKYNQAVATIADQIRQLETFEIFDKGLAPFAIKPKEGSGTSEGTVVAVASDWHVEERVGKEVGGLNRYDMGIARDRATRFFQGVLRLTRLLQQDVKIDNLVLALLGDFITNQLHEANDAEKNGALPVDAMLFAENLIVSGLEFLLDHSKLSLTIPCHSGNHARTTKKIHWSTENGHSLEYMAYTHLAKVFSREPRVHFIIPNGYHSYVQVYDQLIRFHHGHAIKYQGGIGGIFIPAFKAVAQWNKAKKADLDVFGHFHQSKDGGNFLSNGSLIGYNGFAVSIKADFEPPQQTLFLMDKKRGRTCRWPILLETK